MVQPLSSDTGAFRWIIDRFKIRVGGKRVVCSEIISLDPPDIVDFEIAEYKVIGAIVCVPESILVPKRHPEKNQRGLKYLPQTIDNTCGTVALLNLFLNFDPNFKTKSEEEIMNLHDEILEFQKSSGCFEAESVSDNTDFHFVAVLAVDEGEFYEIDGRNPTGVRHLNFPVNDIFKVIQNEYASESQGNMSAMVVYC
jgi:hypothetical protein